MTSEHAGARVDLVVVDVGPVQLSHTAGLIDGGASVQGATVVEEHKIARPERVAHLELVGAGELAESAQGRIRTGWSAIGMSGKPRTG